MTDRASITISQHADVFAFVNEHVGKGSALGAIYAQLPGATQAIDDLALALARRVLEQATLKQESAARDDWMKAAYALIDAREPPLPSGYPAETNVNRLIGWVDGKCERVFIGVIPALDEGGVREVRRVAEWMHRASQLPTEVVHGTTANGAHKFGAFKSTLEETLALRLERDGDLRGLFESNVLVTTVFQTRPCVDLLWRSGRLIVEVDSYRYHSNRDRFTGDRQRDYETGATGYVTLRLTDQEIAGDVELAVQKIRRYVHLRKKLLHV